MTDTSTTSIHALAEWIIVDGGYDGYRAALGLTAELASVGAADVARAIADEPAATGDNRLDALFGALAEHVAFHRDIDAPTWCDGPTRFLREAWFPVDLPSVRVRALVSSPASFWRRGVYIDRSDLDRA